ncbi:MAG: AMP-binding protein, partial [Chloroflexi bacterium]|nr:AMP-binding protein [Chloroflexota bacterium]
MLVPRSLGELVAEKAASNGNRPFLFFGDQTISFHELDERASRFAAGLRRLGVVAGDRVCVMLGNRPEFFDAWLGTAKLGAWTVPINTAYRGDLLRYIVGNSGA